MLKKGISSLIITVLLVAISIGLGSMVIGWVTTTVASNVEGTRTQSHRTTSCNNVNFIVWKKYLYSSDGTNYNNVSFYVENKGNVIAGFVVKIRDQNENLIYIPRDYSQLNQNYYFNKDERKWIYFYCDSCNGSIMHVELIPLYRDQTGSLDLCNSFTRSYDSLELERR
ncbi:MAG: hypothetical protein QXS41_01485 [Candidatus Woesearchaeota archaeon]